MSIWGKRVDAWFDQQTGPRASREDVERQSLRFLWQVGLILLVVIVVVALGGYGR